MSILKEIELPEHVLNLDTVLVRRNETHACCGMEIGQTYEAKIDRGRYYVWVKLPDGSWTDGHAFKGFFELVPHENC